MCYPSIRLEGLEKRRESLKIADMPTEIRTEHLSITNPERYRYGTSLGFSCSNII
jgi:hypothetical protein